MKSPYFILLEFESSSWRDELFSWVGQEQFIVYVTSMVYLKVLVDKWWLQDLSTIAVWITGFINNWSESFSPPCYYFSSKCNSHSTKCFTGGQLFLLAKWVYCLFNSIVFIEENETLPFVAFHYRLNQAYTSAHQIY